MLAMLPSCFLLYQAKHLKRRPRQGDRSIAGWKSFFYFVGSLVHKVTLFSCSFVILVVCASELLSLSAEEAGPAGVAHEYVVLVPEDVLVWHLVAMSIVYITFNLENNWIDHNWTWGRVFISSYGISTKLKLLNLSLTFTWVHLVLAFHGKQ